MPRMGSREIGLVHASSKAGILASLAYIALGLAAPPLGRPEWHIYMMAGGALGAFVIAVESSYIVSALRGREHPLMTAALAGLVASPILALLAPPLGAALGLRAWAITLAVASLAEALPAALASRLSRRLVKASLAGAAYTNLLAAAYLAGAASIRPPPVIAGLGLLYALPLPMIYSVTLNALPSTYKFEPSPAGILLAYILAGMAAALGLEPAHAPTWAPLAAALSTLAYIVGVRAYRAYSLALKAVSEAPSRVAAETHKYFLWGHIYVILISAYLVALTLLNTALGGVKLGCIIHGFAIGFSGLHIFIHAPMMLPVILGIPTARRYNPAPYALLATAAVAPCIGHWLMWPTLLAGLAAATLVVWPAGRPSGRRGRK